MDNSSDLISVSIEPSPEITKDDAIPSEPEYRFNFGKHNGKTLSSVPPNYLLYLIEKKASESRPDLKAALEKHLSKTRIQGSSPEKPSPKPVYDWQRKGRRLSDL